MSGRNPDVVVVGGGVLGTATALALARDGLDTLLLERDGIASGQTAISGGIVRTHYSNAVLVRVAVHSREVMARLAETGGEPTVLDRLGWLFLFDEAAEARVRDVVAMAAAEGSDGQVVGPAELARLLPGVALDGIAAGVFEPGSGRADAAAAAHAYAAAAVAHGATIRQSTAVERLVREGDRVVGVATRGGEIRAGAVVLAAGLGAPALAATAEVELPIVFTREQELLLEAPVATVPPVVVTSLVDRVYLAPRPRRRAPAGQAVVLAGSGYPKPMVVVESPEPAPPSDPAVEADLVAAVVRRFPALEVALRVEATVGYYDVTPDWHPLLGPVPSRPGLHLACGGSGHAFKLAPGIGELVAGGITGTIPRWAHADDLATLGLGRFERGGTLGSAYGGNRA